jgi:hypothetical protein
MYFEDLSVYEYKLPFQMPVIENVGWLGQDKNYTKGDVEVTILNRLRGLIFDNDDRVSVIMNRMRCIHPCPLCGEREVKITNGSDYEYLGAAEILIPNARGELFYAAPTLIYHYIVTHGYKPPKKFLQSLLELDTRHEFDAQNVYDGLVDKYNR